MEKVLTLDEYKKITEARYEEADEIVIEDIGKLITKLGYKVIKVEDNINEIKAIFSADDGLDTEYHLSLVARGYLSIKRIVDNRPWEHVSQIPYSVHQISSFMFKYANKRHVLFTEEAEVIGDILLKTVLGDITVKPFDLKEILRHEVGSKNIEAQVENFCCNGHRSSCWVDVEGVGYGSLGTQSDTEARETILESAKSTLEGTGLLVKLMVEIKHDNGVTFVLPSRHKAGYDFRISFLDNHEGLLF